MIALLLILVLVVLWFVGIATTFYLCGLYSGKFEQKALDRAERYGDWTRARSAEQKWANFFGRLPYVAPLWPAFLGLLPLALLGAIGYYGYKGCDILFDRADASGKAWEKRRRELTAPTITPTAPPTSTRPRLKDCLR